MAREQKERHVYEKAGAHDVDHLGEIFSKTTSLCSAHSARTRRPPEPGWQPL